MQLGDRLERLREKHEQGLLNSKEFLKQLLELARDVLTAEKTVTPENEQERAKAALTELFSEVKSEKTPVIVERIVSDIDEIVRVVRFRVRQAERDELAEQVTELSRWLGELPGEIAGPEDAQSGDAPAGHGGLAKLRVSLAATKLRINTRLGELKREGRSALAEFAQERDATDWWRAVQEAEADLAAYAAELQAKGIDPKTYSQLQQQLRAGQTLLKELTGKESARDTAKQAVERAWTDVAQLLDARLPMPAEAVLADMAADLGRRHVRRALDDAARAALARLAVDAATADLFGAYVRYSCENSNPRSLDDQLRQILHKAREHRLFVPWCLVFADASLSGADASREGYTALKEVLAAAPVVRGVWIDEFSRGGRDTLEWFRLRPERGGPSCASAGGRTRSSRSCRGRRRALPSAHLSA